MNACSAMPFAAMRRCSPARTASKRRGEFSIQSWAAQYPLRNMSQKRGDRRKPTASLPAVAAGTTLRRTTSMSSPEEVVFLFDVDNTLLDNDHVQADLRKHLEREFGRESSDRYWAILDELRDELGYVDYLGALQRY